MSVLCLGEAMVDLICPAPLTGPDMQSMRGARAFVPRLGGTMANVAVSATRLGTSVSLAGAAGTDPWGQWVLDALRAEGVGLESFVLAPEATTTIAFVTVDCTGEPTYTVRGHGQAAGLGVIAERLPGAVRAHDALILGSNTLAQEPERELTLAARSRALELGHPVIFDVNVRMHRWENRGQVAREAGACVGDALLVKANASEAEILTGERDPRRAAEGLRAGGARNVLITLGREGALLRGEVCVDVAGRPAQVVNTAGAGDVLLGVLLARLSDAGFYAPAIAAALPEACEAAARASESWGATGPAGAAAP